MSTELKASIEEITAEIAAEYLAKCNTTNRPMNTTIANRYALEMLRKKWKMNGEALIFSKSNKILSAQHRLFAVVKAEELRKKDPEHYRQFGINGPLKIKFVVVRGIDDDAADTIDQGKARTPGDVVFRLGLWDEFVLADGKSEFSVADKKKLAKILATTIRLVWLRIGGKRVADAPKFPVSEMMDFHQAHPKIVEVVTEVYRLEDGANRLVSSIVTPAYLAAITYLGMTSATEREAYDADGTIDYSRETDAQYFAEKIAEGSGLEAGDPMLAVRKIFQRDVANGGQRDRDGILNTLALAWNFFIDNIEKEDADKIQVTTKMVETVRKPNEPFQPARVGGLDVVVDDLSSDADDADEAGDEESKPKATKKVTKKAVVKKATKKAVAKKAVKKVAKKTAAKE